LECEEYVLVRVTEDSSELVKYRLDLLGVQDVRWDKGSTAEDYTVFYQKKE
jgi:hypothetical protein